VFGIAPADSEETIVGLQDVPPVVVIEQENSRVGGMVAVAPLVRKGSITESGPSPPPAVGLEDAACGQGGDESKVARRFRIGVVQTVEAAADIGEAKSPNQALAHAVALDGGERGVLGREFGAVIKIEAPHLQGAGLASTQALESYIELFGKHHTAVLAVV